MQPRGQGITCRLLFGAAAIAICLAAWPAQAQEAERPLPKFSCTYMKEDLGEKEGVVSATGRIHLYDPLEDFEIEIEHGGLVLWVDTVEYRKWQKTANNPGVEPEEGEETPPAAEGEIPTVESIFGKAVREIYAEGGVRFRRGPDFEIEADRLYFNFAEHRAVVFKGEMFLRVGEEGVGPRLPLVIRAKRIHQTVKDEFVATESRITTCLFGDPHYTLNVETVTVERDGKHYNFDGKNHVLDIGGVPSFWFPVLRGGTEFGLDPIRDVDAGVSSKYGIFAGLTLGGKIRGAEGEKPLLDIEFPLVFRSRRGFGGGLDAEYERGGYRGMITGFYQYDRADEDRVTETPIEDPNRGRVRWQHYQEISKDFLGGRTSGTAEFSWISDQSFLTEYYTAEQQEGKAQEDVAYLSQAWQSNALSVTGRWQSNNFLTQTEYLPRAFYDHFASPIFTDIAGTGADLTVEAEAEGVRIFRAYADDEPESGVLTNRFSGRGTFYLPFSLGPVRLEPEFGTGYTAYGGGQDLNRLDLYGGVRANMDVWRLYPDVESEFWQLKGLRHVMDFVAAYKNRFAVSEPSSEVVIQDTLDLLDELEAVDMRFRTRWETKRHGRIVDWIDWEVRGILFPSFQEARPTPLEFREEYQQGISALLLPEEELWRSIDRKGMGPLTSEFRCMLSDDLFFVADAWYDFETSRFETYSEAIRYRVNRDLTFFLGHRAIQGNSSVITAWIDTQITARWSARFRTQWRFREGQRLNTGIALRRHFHDYLVEFSFRVNEEQNVSSLSLTVEPTALFDSRKNREEDRTLEFDRQRWYR